MCLLLYSCVVLQCSKAMLYNLLFILFILKDRLQKQNFMTTGKKEILGRQWAQKRNFFLAIPTETKQNCGKTIVSLKHDSYYAIF